MKENTVGEREREGLFCDREEREEEEEREINIFIF